MRKSLALSLGLGLLSQVSYTQTIPEPTKQKLQDTLSWNSSREFFGPQKQELHNTFLWNEHILNTQANKEITTSLELSKEEYFRSAIHKLTEQDKERDNLDRTIVHHHLYVIFDLYYDRDGKTLKRKKLTPMIIDRIDKEIETLRQYIRSQYFIAKIVLSPKTISKELLQRNDNDRFYNAFFGDNPNYKYEGFSPDNRKEAFRKGIEELIHLYKTSR